MEHELGARLRAIALVDRRSDFTPRGTNRVERVPHLESLLVAGEIAARAPDVALGQERQELRGFRLGHGPSGDVNDGPLEEDACSLSGVVLDAERTEVGLVNVLRRSLPLALRDDRPNPYAGSPSDRSANGALLAGDDSPLDLHDAVAGCIGDAGRGRTRDPPPAAQSAQEEYRSPEDQETVEDQAPDEDFHSFALRKRSRSLAPAKPPLVGSHPPGPDVHAAGSLVRGTQWPPSHCRVAVQ